MSSRQKLVLAIPVLVALIAAVALWITNTGGSSPASDAIIEAKIPPENTKVLQQAEAGIDLISGWDAQLTLNGRVIPDDQLTRIAPQGRFTFTPGAGKEVEVYQAGQNCMLAKYWQLANPNQTFTTSWCFSVL